jgi:hypothetical protein
MSFLSTDIGSGKDEGDSRGEIQKGSWVPKVRNCIGVHCRAVSQLTENFCFTHESQ